MSYNKFKKYLAKCGALITSLALVVSFSTGCKSTTKTSTTSTSNKQYVYEEMFTERDLDQEYEDGVEITLKDDATTCSSNDVTIKDNTITIKASGTYILSGELSDGQIIVDVAEDEKVEIVLNGAKISSSTSAAIYVKSAKKVFLTTAEDSKNTITTTADFEADTESNVDAAIFSKANLTLKGQGTLTVESTGSGIVSKDNLRVTGSTITVKADKNGLEGKDSVRVADGTLNITAGKNGIDSDNDKSEDDQDKGLYYSHGATIVIDSENDAIHTSGNTYIDGGTYEIEAADDGIHTDSNLKVISGQITVKESYEGLEGHTIQIKGGKIDVTASDDGFNAAGGNDSSSDENPLASKAGGVTADNPFDSDEEAEIIISGGTIKVDAGGDGIDSNGTIVFKGGKTYVSGPTNDGNSAIDYGISATMNGGTLIAAGSTGMVESFSEDSKQCVATVTTSGGSGQIQVKNSDGDVIAKYTPTKNYECVIISTPDMEKEASYVVCYGEESTDFTQEDTIFSNVQAGMGQGSGSKPSGNPPSGSSGGTAPSGDGSKTPPSGSKPSSKPSGKPGSSSSSDTTTNSDTTGDTNSSDTAGTEI